MTRAWGSPARARSNSASISPLPEPRAGVTGTSCVFFFVAVARARAGFFAFDEVVEGMVGALGSSDRNASVFCNAATAGHIVHGSRQGDPVNSSTNHVQRASA